jgi:phosphatidylserine synthase
MGLSLRHAVPNVVTVGALVLSMQAIMDALNGQEEAALYLVAFASIVDVFDGAAARLLGASSLFGKYLDTLSDAVTGGVAPSVILYEVYFRSWGGAGNLVAAGWTVAVLGRLAYFQSTEERSPGYFVGLPAPLASSLLTGFALFSSHVWHGYPYRWAVLGMMAVLAPLMLSNLKLEKGAFFTPERIIRSWRGRAALLGIVVAAVCPWACQLIVFSIVITGALARDLVTRLGHRQLAVAAAGLGQVEGVAAHD